VSQPGSAPASSLVAYSEWLRRRGTGASTIQQYLFHAGRAAGGEDPFDRVTDRALSPKYRRVCRAAIISFARFNKDDALVEQIKEVKLPSPVRMAVKVPLTVEAWRALRAEIDAADYITEPVRAALGIMASRGLRRGDVLRLHRKEVADALKTSTLSFVAKGERRLEFGVGSWRHYLETLAECFAGERDAKTVADLISKNHDAAGRQLIRILRAVAGRVKGIDAKKIAPHDLRRTVATHFFEACGRDPVKLQAFMQWASLEVALGYVSAGSREGLDDIAEGMLK
jgi:integrase